MIVFIVTSHLSYINGIYFPFKSADQQFYNEIGIGSFGRIKEEDGSNANIK